MTGALMDNARTLIASTRVRRKAMRRILAALYGPHCIWCGHEFGNIQVATLEHLVPAEFGGASDVHNLRLACYPCNSDRNTWYQIMLGRTRSLRLSSARKGCRYSRDEFINGAPFL